MKSYTSSYSLKFEKQKVALRITNSKSENKQSYFELLTR